MAKKNNNCLQLQIVRYMFDIYIINKDDVTCLDINWSIRWGERSCPEVLVPLTRTDRTRSYKRADDATNEPLHIHLYMFTPTFYNTSKLQVFQSFYTCVSLCAQQRMFVFAFHLNERVTCVWTVNTVGHHTHVDILTIDLLLNTQQ